MILFQLNPFGLWVHSNANELFDNSLKMTKKKLYLSKTAFIRWSMSMDWFLLPQSSPCLFWALSIICNDDPNPKRNVLKHFENAAESSAESSESVCESLSGQMNGFILYLWGHHINHYLLWRFCFNMCRVYFTYILFLSSRLRLPESDCVFFPPSSSSHVCFVFSK